MSKNRVHSTFIQGSLLQVSRHKCPLKVSAKLFLQSWQFLMQSRCSCCFIGEVSIIDIALNSKIIESTTRIYVLKFDILVLVHTCSFFQINILFFCSSDFFSRKICQLDLANAQNIIWHNSLKTNLYVAMFRTKQK